MEPSSNSNGHQDAGRASSLHQTSVLDIVVGIDGTASNEWFVVDKANSLPGKAASNSHVFNFVVDNMAKFQNKKYHAGTDDQLTGWDVEKIVEHCQRFIASRLKVALSEKDLHGSASHHTLADAGIRLNLVGHSRGGLAAILLARKLQSFRPRPDIPVTHVHFLGLYDAVDRHIGWGADTIPNNVVFACHARRDIGISTFNRGRFVFGNTGTKYKAPTIYQSHTFRCTHSGAGGDPWGGDHPKAFSKELDRYGSGQVDIWMRERARHAGLKFKAGTATKTSMAGHS